MSQKRVIIFLVIGITVSACWNRRERESVDADPSGKNRDTVNLNFTVEEAPEWTGMFHRNHGWFGADGIFSIPLGGTQSKNNDTILFVFSDTMIGEPDSMKFSMVNNSVAYLKGKEPVKENIDFFYDESEDGKPKALFIPNTPKSLPSDYYWLGDGFVNLSSNSTYLFAYRMRNMNEGAWSFSQVGNVLIVIPEGSRPPFKDHKQIETPFLIRGENESDNAHLGAGIFVNTASAGAPTPDGYIYVYGKKGKTQGVIVARVLPNNFEQFDKWAFWNGSNWVSSMSEAVAVAHRASNELSVSPLGDGRYAMVFQIDGIGDRVGLCLGLSPYGPFGPIIELWKTTEGEQRNYYTYNAKAHPTISNPGELLISYNVNAFDFFNELKKNPYLYRPRFIRLKLNE